jgi:RNA polymerase sigma factor (sigma-70 family)
VELARAGTLEGRPDAAAAPDRARVARWAEAHAAALTGWALRLTRERGLAEDVVQATFVVALERPEAAVPPVSERAWLFGIARRLALRALRARGGLLARLFRRAAPAFAEAADAPALADERRALLAAALARRPARQREILLLVFHEGLTIDEAAHVMAISPGAARRHYHRAKEALRAELARSGAFDDDA